MPLPIAIAWVMRAEQFPEDAAFVLLHRAWVDGRIRARCPDHHIPPFPGGQARGHSLRSMYPTMDFPEHDWRHLPDWLRWRGRDLREEWVRDHTEWHAADLETLLGLPMPPAAAPAKERGKPGPKPKWDMPALEVETEGLFPRDAGIPQVDALISTLQEIAEKCTGKKPSPRHARTSANRLRR